MEKTNWLKYMSWTEFDARRKNCDTVIIPCGAIEEYGPHMPLGSDIIVAESVSELVAEKVNAVIGPVVEVGESFNLFEFPGTMRLSMSSYRAVMEDILNSLIQWGFKNFLFINAHNGNTPIITNLAKEYQRKAGIVCAQVDWWRYVQAVAADCCEYTGWMAHGHASECGTSVMLYLHPELVDMSKAKKSSPVHPHFGKYPEMITYYEVAQTTASGVLGDPEIATKEKGEAIVSRCVDRIAEYMRFEFGC